MNRNRLYGLFLLLAACTQPPNQPNANDPLRDALLAATAGDDEATLAALRVTVATDPLLVQRALLEPGFTGSVRESIEFRRLLHDAAVEHGIAKLELVPPDEPGERLQVHGRTVDQQGAALAAVEVHVFATDKDGRYHPTIDGEGTPRIFGSVVSDENGRFTITTVRPGPYPGTRNPRHLHVMARRGDLRLAAPGYAVFDDDPLLFEPGNEEPRGEAIRIAMDAAGTRGELVLPLR